MTKDELKEQLIMLFESLPAIVEKHIDYLIREGYSPKEIARACYFIYDHLGQDKENIKQYGIKGLVPLYIDKANKYYDGLRKQKELQEQQMREIGNKTIQIRKVKPERRKRTRKEIDINEL
jgi:hypothetical protein